MTEPTSAATRSRFYDVLLVLLFLAGSIFAAWKIAGAGGPACWLLGAVNFATARSAWGLFRA